MIRRPLLPDSSFPEERLKSKIQADDSPIYNLAATGPAASDLAAHAHVAPHSRLPRLRAFHRSTETANRSISLFCRNFQAENRSHFS
jgi:hypothetical protein